MLFDPVITGGACRPLFGETFGWNFFHVHNSACLTPFEAVPPQLCLCLSTLSKGDKARDIYNN